MKYFQSCKTKQEAKKLFRELAKTYHPDKGGDNETMAAIIAEYESIIKKLPSDASGSAQSDNMTEEQYKAHISAEMQNVIDNISHLPIDIEIIGTWIWVSGNTKPYKAYLTAYNFSWHAKKEMWFWHMEPKRKRYGKQKDIEDIRATYGTIKVNNVERYALAQ